MREKEREKEREYTIAHCFGSADGSADISLEVCEIERVEETWTERQRDGENEKTRKRENVRSEMEYKRSKGRKKEGKEVRRR